jgi:hypothetical protein
LTLGVGRVVGRVAPSERGGKNNDLEVAPGRSRSVRMGRMRGVRETIEVCFSCYVVGASAAGPSANSMPRFVANWTEVTEFGLQRPLLSLDQHPVLNGVSSNGLATTFQIDKGRWRCR